MTHNQKRSSEKQNLSTNRKGKRKSRDVEELGQARRVWHRTVIGMIKGNTNRKRPREQSEQWTSNEISFPSIPGCQLVDSPIILEAPIEGFRVCMIYIDRGSSFEGSPAKSEKFRRCGLHYPLNDKVSHRQWDCNNDDQERNPPRMSEDGRSIRTAMEGRIIPLKMQASDSEGATSKDKEGSRGQTDKTREPDDIIQPSPISSKKYTQVDEKDKGKDESLEKSPGSKPLEKAVIHDGYPDQTITIGGSITAEYIYGLIEILRKHADAFAWTPIDMTGISCFVAEYELKTYPHIEPRVQRKRSIASDRRKIVKDEVT
ncbi:hypothetical protein Tco_1519680 [Tanacetum coccineum]